MEEVQNTDGVETDQGTTDDRWTCVCSDEEHIHISLKQFQKHSGYFTALVRSQVEEHDNQQVNLELVSAKLLTQIQTLLDILDSGQFELAIDLQVFDVFSQWSDLEEMDTLLIAIDYLDMHTLRRLCDRWICSVHSINTDNLDYLLQLCSRFMFNELEKKILSFLLKNAWCLTKSDIEILPFNLLKCLLGSNKANVSSEWDLVRILDTWCIKNCQKDLSISSDKNVAELCQCLQIACLLNDVRCYSRIEDISYVTLRNTVKTIVCRLQTERETSLQTHPTLAGARRGQSLLLAMRTPFGRKLDRACSFAKNFNMENNEDIMLSESQPLSLSIPCDSLREFCVCRFGQFVYVAGGQHKYSLAGQFAVQHVYRLDLDELEWKVMSPLAQSRCLFYMDDVDGHMYAVGGINADGELSSVEQYNPITDQWSDAQSLDYRIHEHAGCMHDKKLYISGGHDGTCHVDTLSQYDVVSDTWSRCAPMLSTRSCHTMACLNDRLYVIGGSRITKCKVYVMQTMECYSTQTDQWSEVCAQFPSPYTACLSVYTRPWAGRLLVLGGYSYKSRKYRLEMQCFCERTCSWSQVPVKFNSTRKDMTDTEIVEIKVRKSIADQLIRDRRSCTLK